MLQGISIQRYRKPFENQRITLNQECFLLQLIPDIVNRLYSFAYKTIFYISCLIRMNNVRQDFFYPPCNYLGHYFCVYINEGDWTPVSKSERERSFPFFSIIAYDACFRELDISPFSKHSIMQFIKLSLIDQF